MPNLDLVFEGGGAKGMVFVGALEELFRDTDIKPGRLLGTSAGAITAVLLAAGYTPAEMRALLAESDVNGDPVFASFMADPAPFDEESVRRSAIRTLLADLNLPFVPDFAEDRIDAWIARELANTALGRHLFSFVDRGGWYSAAPFVSWIRRKLDQGETPDGPRRYGGLSLKEFHDATGVEMTLVAADTTASRLLLLNHRTAPGCPVIYAVRMSMSIPLLWQEVIWENAWGPYLVWSEDTQQLVESEITGHAIVDGGLLSNFPIALFLSDRPDVASVVGPAESENTLGLLIDETLPVSGQPPRGAGSAAAGLGALRTVQRLRRIADTATGAHDNMAKSVFARHVVRLPAAGYGTTEFGMCDARRVALVNAGRQAMAEFVARQRREGTAPRDLAQPMDTASLANEAARIILQQ